LLGEPSKPCLFVFATKCEGETVGCMENREEFVRKERVVERQITVFKRAAWVCIAAGVLAAVYGLTRLGAGPSSLEKLGSFLQGAVGSLWALAGLFLVFVAFLGQRLQLLYQQEELKATQDEVRTQTRELQRMAAAMHASARLSAIGRVIEAYDLRLAGLKSQRTGLQQTALEAEINALHEKRTNRIFQLEEILGNLEKGQNA